MTGRSIRRRRKELRLRNDREYLGHRYLEGRMSLGNAMLFENHNKQRMMLF